MTSPGAGALLAAARVVPLVALAPPLEGILTRATVAGALAALVWPAVLVPRGPLAPLVAREAVVGLVLGLLVALPFWAARAAGALVDDSLALAQPGAPRTSRRRFGEAYGLFALAVFGALGGPRLVAGGLAASYAALPLAGEALGAGGTPGAAMALTLSAGARLIASAAAIAAPALAALVLADLAAGLIARAQPAAPQILGAPAVRLMVATLALAVAAAAAVALLAGAWRALPALFGDAAGALPR